MHIDPTLMLPGGPNDPPPTPPQTADEYLTMREAQLAGELVMTSNNEKTLTCNVAKLREKNEGA